ncbi:serine/threonine-protein kinase [Actinomadura macrotermitis]|uniref:non-specific serine/threonine protein kinase n=1 Tax=Actinomadura macrotermitis TaxID=2585200 RepID=A0A7K0C0Q1_9ACTN|nr:serine/threonine-protein kinase [Actinomadura macrotermitis]MQY06926.1 Serine/threonine-protein kinase PknD [Actinomadura macrotermitis]
MDEGRQLAGRYRLDSVVGRGGMGTVWRAYDLTLDREVAVKEVVLPPGLSDTEREVLYERTFREARASARLNHPGVVTVHDVVEAQDRPWIVMELVRARSLQDLLEEGPLEHRRVASIGLQMLGALRHAHEKGILHRDVKPSNVLITDSGRVVLTDFGIAQVEGDATLTQTGLVMGSPAYIPPERAQGERAVPASDLWALGATLYAALEGRSPYERSNAMSSLQAALLEPAPPARNAGPLARVLDGLLVREPMHRMTAAQVQPLLQRVADMPPPAVAQTVTDGTVLDDPSRRQAGRSTSQTVLDPAQMEAVTRHDSGRRPELYREQPRREPPPQEQTRQATDWETGTRSSWDPPATPAHWEGPAEPPHHGATAAPAPGRDRRRTTVIVTIAVILVVAAVLAGAFILRGRFAGGTKSGLGGGASVVRQGANYSVTVPKSWTWQRNGDGKPILASPDGRTSLLVDSTPWGLARSTAFEKASSQHKYGAASPNLPGYSDGQVRPVDYLGTNAADWEFRFRKDGTVIHVVDRFVQVDGAPFALYFRTPEQHWAASADIRGRIFASFRPRT